MTEPSYNFASTNSGRNCATLAAVSAIAEMILFFYRPVNQWQPPSLYAVLIGFAALFAGLCGIYMLRGQPQCALWRTMAIIATLCGISASFIFAAQSVHWRARVQQCELDNVQMLADVCRQYAIDHNHVFPPDLQTALNAAKIPAMPLSPLSDHTTADYQYAGEGINASAWTHEGVDPNIITIYSSEPRLGDDWVVGFAGHNKAKLLSEEDFAKALDANDKARKDAGLPAANYHLPWRVAATQPTQ